MTPEERAGKAWDELSESEGGWHRFESVVAAAIRDAVEEDRTARCGNLKYKCGCPAVPSEKVKAFCPTHMEVLDGCIPD